jgi:hypothetical protein
LLKGVFPSSIKGIPSRANDYGKEEALLVGLRLDNGITGLLAVKLKKLHINAILEGKLKPLQSKKKKSKAMFYLGKLHLNQRLW